MIDIVGIKNSITNFRVFSSEETTRLLFEYTKLKNNTQNFRDDRVIYAVVGPSGSGKSTFIANMYANGVLGRVPGDIVPFINRHYYNRTVGSDQRVYLQQEIHIKQQLCQQGKSFLIEAADFNDGYLDFLREIQVKHDYKICMIYLTKRFPNDNISCVRQRVREGDHGKKTRELNLGFVEQQYEIDGKNLDKAMNFCDSVFVIHNQTQKQIPGIVQKPRLLAQKVDGGQIMISSCPYSQRQYYEITGKLKRPQKRIGYLLKPGGLPKGRCLIRRLYSYANMNQQLEHQYYINENGEIVDKETGKVVDKNKLIMMGRRFLKPKK